MDKTINCINKDKKQVGRIEFKNLSDDVGEIYLYGEICSGSYKWDDTDVILSEFKEQLDEYKDKKTLNIYQNSPGGSVTTGVNILNLLKRHKAIKNVYIDALSASISSVITMSYDNLYVYPTSMLMIHKPMIGLIWGANATELKKYADDLDRIEENMIIPAYMEKATDELTDDVVKVLLKAETWMGTKDIQKYFINVTILEEVKDMVACIKDKSIFDNYRNAPEIIKNLLIENESETADQNITNQEPDIIVEDTEKIEYLKAKLKLELEL